jgi:hypothetical protein
MLAYAWRSAVGLGLLMALHAERLLAWGPTGHRVVARIAWMNMTPAARTRAIAILNAAAPATGILTLRPATGDPASRDAWLFVETATWPDIVKSDPSRSQFDHRDWHFADHFWSLVNGKAKLDPNRGPKAQNAVERLMLFDQQFRTNHVTSAEHAIDLAWILHLMGDLHQPLHNESRETSAHPTGDIGGNSFKLNGTTELHGYWDGILDEVFKKDRTTLGAGFPANAPFDSPDYVNAWATLIVGRHPKSGMPHDSTVDAFEHWSEDGLTTAERDAYVGVKEQQPASKTYRRRVDGISEEAIAEAGYRLAALLNAILN